MRSVPATGLPFAELKPGQTRSLPTRLVSLDPPNPQAGVKLPEQGEPLRLGDIAEINDSPRVQKALKRLQAEKAPTAVSQLVMWNVASGLDWETIAGLSRDWANRYELALARDFVDRLDGETLADGEAGQLLFEITAKDAAGETRAAALKKLLDGKEVLGLKAVMGIPERPSRPSLACRVQLQGGDVQVQLSGSDTSGRKWLPFGKFALKASSLEGDAGALKLADSVAEGLIGRLVRAQVVRGERQKGKLTYGIRIDNASPLQLNGLAALGVESEKEAEPHVLAGISIPPRRSLTVPASEEAVKMLHLKRGIRLIALDLSGL